MIDVVISGIGIIGILIIVLLLLYDLINLLLIADPNLPTVGLTLL